MIVAVRLHQLMCTDPRTVRDCCAFLQPGDEVLLIDAAVQLLTDADALLARLKNQHGIRKISALRADVLSRGLKASIESSGISLLSDRQWVEQLCRCSQVLSWK